VGPSSAEQIAPTERARCGFYGVEIDRPALDELEARIVAARSLAHEREIATADTRLAQAVLGRARLMAPGSESLGRAFERLGRYHARIANAGSRSEILDRFRRMTAGSPSVDSGCDFTGIEIIAIFLGFVLGIIPGLILLLLLC
jgi:hypothetical protein